MKKVNKMLLELYSDWKQLLLLSFLGCISYLMEGVIPSDPNVIQASGLWVGIGSLVVSGVGMMMKSNANKKAADIAGDNNQLTADIAKQNLAFQRKSRKARYSKRSL